jgi:hypothetical protein
LQIFIKRNPSDSKYKALRRPISRIMNKQDKKTKNNKRVKEKRGTKEGKEQLNLTLKINTNPK